MLDCQYYKKGGIVTQKEDGRSYVIPNDFFLYLVWRSSKSEGNKKKNRDGIQSVVRSPNWFQIKSSFMPHTAALAALQQKRAENDGRKRSTNDIFPNDGSQFILLSNNLDSAYYIQEIKCIM